MTADRTDEPKRPGDSGFDLGAPVEGGKTAAGGEARRGATGKKPARAADPRLVADSRAFPEWKGLEEEEEFEPEVDFGHKGVQETEMDMTPMVDVTFLLLIFFMVTASFTLQKSLEQPRVETNEPSTVVEDREDEDQYVEVIIDQFNNYRLTSRDAEEIEAPSDQEMRTRLRDMIRSTTAKRVVIRVHGDAWHEKVVTAWDAANNNSIEDISIQMTEEDF